MKTFAVVLCVLLFSMSVETQTKRIITSPFSGTPKDTLVATTSWVMYSKTSSLVGGETITGVEVIHDGLTGNLMVALNNDTTAGRIKIIRPGESWYKAVSVTRVWVKSSIGTISARVEIW